MNYKDMFFKNKIKMSENDAKLTVDILDHSLMRYIDSEQKAYLLGCIIGVGIITDNEILVEFNIRDFEIVQKLRDFVCPEIHLIETGNLISFRIISKTIVDDVRMHLQCPVYFPHAINDQLKWDFLRGFFDSAGCISNIKDGYPKCSINTSCPEMLEDIKKFSCIKCKVSKNCISCDWCGINAIEFLEKLYKNASIYSIRNYKKFIFLVNHSTNHMIDRLPIFRWARTIEGAPKPEKNRFSDSGYDLHLLKKIKVQGGVHYFDTGIQVQPENGYYFDLVGRSSISKSGWMLANNIGIIDSSYTGTIIVALVKIDPEAFEIALPCKLVQLIPRKLILMESVEVDSLEDTERGENGFGSSGK
jgi:dUTP pyrophosphatase